MSVFARRALAAAVAAACTLGLLALALVPSTAAPGGPELVVPPVAAQNVIVIPSPDQVSNSIDASGCPWLKAGTADVHTMSAASAPLLATPLAAVEYAVNGMSGVARLYGC